MFTPKETKCPKCGKPYWMNNGCDRKAAKRMPVVSGWRGRECVGFNSALSKRSE